MLILGIETATQQVGCAIGGYEGVRATFHAARRRRHVETLAPAIDFVCQQADVPLSELGAVAVDVGPGLFSGLRVGVTTAKTLAQALRLPVIGVSSLDLLAFPVRHSNRLIVPVIDARRGELYYGFYRQVPGGVQCLSGYQVGKPGELVSELLARGEDVLMVGDGVVRYADELSGVVRCELAGSPHLYPSASALVALAHPRAVREDFVSPSELEPMYLRKTDAEINWEVSAGWGRAPKPHPNPGVDDDIGGPDGRDDLGGPDGRDDTGGPDGRDDTGGPDGRDDTGGPDGRGEAGRQAS